MEITKTLYEQDFNLWLENQVKILGDRHFSYLDIDNLIEELEAMGRSDKNGLKSHLRIVLMHLLKYKYQPERRSNSWDTIIEHRLRIQDIFDGSPSLKRYFAEVFPQCYGAARKLAAAETKLPINNFPIECPFTEEETLNLDFLPNI